MKTCPQCGKNAEDSRSYCPRCGAPLLLSGTEEAEEKAEKKRRSLKKRISFIGILVLFLLIGALLLFYTPTPRYREARDLGSAYLRLFSQGKEKELAALFPRELLSAMGTENPDPYRLSYGLKLIPLGVYDVTKTSELSVEAINRRLRNDYGLGPLAEDYARVLAGGVVNETDLWFQLDLIKIGRFWYLYQVS